MTPVSSVIGLVLISLLAGCSCRPTHEQAYNARVIRWQESQNDRILEERIQKLLNEAAVYEAQGKPLTLAMKNARGLAELRRIGTARQLKAEKEYREKYTNDLAAEIYRNIKKNEEEAYLRSIHVQ